MTAKPIRKQIHDFTERPGGEYLICSKCERPRSEHSKEYVVDESGQGKEAAIEQERK